MSSSIISAILSDALESKQIELTDVYTIEVDNKRMISEVAILLSKNYPFNRCLQHLKRVKPMSNEIKTFKLIIGLVEDLEKDEIQEKLKGVNYQNLSIISVPKNKPYNRWQFEECIKYWPINFHENKYVTKCLTGSFFTNTEKEKIEKMMIKIQAFSQANDFLTFGIIVNKKKEIIASSNESIDHPLRHCVINLVDKVASLQGGGVWFKLPNPINSKLNKSKDDPYLCTNYDIFINTEPCLICAMALIHSRIKRIFFTTSTLTKSKCPADSALSVIKIHALPNLNHHFEVWKLDLN